MDTVRDFVAEHLTDGDGLAVLVLDESGDEKTGTATCGIKRQYVGSAGPRPAQTMTLNAADSAAVDKVCAQATRCVVVVVSGRPMILDPQQLSHIDALVAAWLPGSEGAGVADTLFGRRPYTGKLSVTWPRSLDQEPINVGDAGYDPLYPFGYGLQTRARSN
jgi:Glycosyl hydrolase family 3 C-terminal domain